MDFSAVMNLVLGGGLVATIIAIITLKSTVREARAKAEKATAEAETVRIDNTEHATPYPDREYCRTLKRGTE